jgi:hypothetical protein
VAWEEEGVRHVVDLERCVIVCEGMTEEAARWLPLHHEALWLPVIGRSMRPLFGAGDEAALLPISWRQARLGDIAVFAKPDEEPPRWIVHRIALIEEAREGEVFTPPATRLLWAAWRSLLHTPQWSEKAHELSSLFLSSSRSSSLESLSWRCWTRGDNRRLLDDGAHGVNAFLGVVRQIRRGREILDVELPSHRLHHAFRYTYSVLRRQLPFL